VTAEVAAVIVLQRAGRVPGFGPPRSDVATWLRETAPLDVTGAVLRIVALGAAWWLLLSTLWWLAVAARGATGKMPVPAMPGTRRLVEAALALTIVGASTLTAPVAWARSATTAVAAPPSTTAPAPPGSGVLDPGGDGNGVRTGHAGLAAVPPSTPTTTPTTTLPTTTPPTTTPTPAPAPAPAAPTAAADVHVVVAGENLWSIAAARLGATSGWPVGELRAADVARYWVALCDLNRATLRSGNLSLIYPGEVVRLPSS
jgi:hypothetical protein